MPKSAPDLGVEWQECRQTIARFDGILSDTRKYGFTLVTVLLTANALVTTSNPVVDRTAASIVVMALLLVLYLIESYYNDLLVATASRAIALEGNHDHISGQLSAVATRQQVKVLIQAVYVLFVVVAGGIAAVSVITAGRSPWGGLIGLVVAAFVVLGAMLVVHQSSISGPAMRAVMALVGRLGLNP
jgi:hypothetical protein